MPRDAAISAAMRLSFFFYCCLIRCRLVSADEEPPPQLYIPGPFHRLNLFSRLAGYAYNYYFDFMIVFLLAYRVEVEISQAPFHACLPHAASMEFFASEISGMVKRRIFLLAGALSRHFDAAPYPARRPRYFSARRADHRPPAWRGSVSPPLALLGRPRWRFGAPFISQNAQDDS